jgi:hypothetical protein
MSLDQRLVDSLATYADGVDMTSTDLDRMQQDLHRRLRQPHRPRRTRLVLAAAAVLVLVAAVAAGALWLRRPDTSVPADLGAGAAPPPGVYLLDNGAGGRAVAAIHADGTESDFDAARFLVDPVLPVPVSPWRMDGEKFVFDGRNEQGQLCRNTAGIHPQRDGRVVFDEGTLAGPGCPAGGSIPAFTGTRLSPGSEAGRAITPSAAEPVSPVTAPVQLEGIWLVQGSGTVLGVVENQDADAKYVLDDRGEVDRSPKARGALKVSDDSRMVLISPGCGDTVLDRAHLQGASQQANPHGGSFGLSLTATVTEDPCDRFGGRGVVTLIRVV